MVGNPVCHDHIEVALVMGQTRQTAKVEAWLGTQRSIAFDKTGGCTGARVYAVLRQVNNVFGAIVVDKEASGGGGAQLDKSYMGWSLAKVFRGLVDGVIERPNGRRVGTSRSLGGQGSVQACNRATGHVQSHRVNPAGGIKKVAMSHQGFCV